MVSVEKLGPASVNIEDRRGVTLPNVWDSSTSDKLMWTAGHLGAAGVAIAIDDVLRWDWRDLRARMPSLPSGPAQAATIRSAGRLLGRLLPGIGAGFTALWVWEILNQHTPPIKDGVKVGPPVGAPNYMPPGWALWEERDVGPPENWEWNSFNIGANYKTANLAPGTWWDGVGGWNQALGFPGPPSPKEIGIQYKPNIGPAFISSGKQKWVYTGTGAGSTTGTVSDVHPSQRYKDRDKAWPLNPAVVPSIAPSLVAPAARAHPQVMPIPQRHIWRVAAVSAAEPLIERISVSPPPVVIPRPGEVPGYIPQRPPIAWNPNAPQIVYSPTKAGFVYEPNDHRYEPPAKNTVEKKYSTSHQVAKKIFGLLTESHDAISSFHKALPKDCRRARTWRDSQGKWHRALASSMLRDIKNCAGHLNVEKALIYLAANQLQDLAIGVTSRWLNSRHFAVLRSGTPYGLGTRVSKPGQAAEGHWSSVITDAGDAVADWFGRNFQQIPRSTEPIPVLRHVRSRRRVYRSRNKK